MNVNELYNNWLNNVGNNEDLINELKAIKDNKTEIYERFYKELEFGTAGLRGIIGAGTNRMNIYTVRKATQGLANYIHSLKKDKASVAIAFDSRIKSDVFARESACVLAANGIKVFISKELQPVPVLSFTVRELKCVAGIMITASHNPAKYNGYKCYGEDGCQMTDISANAVYEQIKKIDIFKDIKICDFEKAIHEGMISFIDDEVYEKYLSNVKKQRINKNINIKPSFKVVYTPLNGAGNKLVRRALNDIGINNVIVVKEQEMPDGNFPTCKFPNPEVKEALNLAIDLALKENADLVLATDPDSDRVGIAVKNKENYVLLTGNEVGILLINYILSCRSNQGTLPNKPVAVKTIVSSEMVGQIASRYNCELRNVLTGFKYIGEQILNLEKNKEENRFMFGFEESYGYLAGTYVRDKDGVVASMLICEMAAYYAQFEKSLIDVLNELYDEYGYYQNSTSSFEFEGSAGMSKMADIMEKLRTHAPEKIAEKKVIKINDYILSETKDVLTGKSMPINLPKSNVLFYFLDGGATAIVRPSGTEPKIKLYVTSVGKNLEDSLNLKSRIEVDMKNLMGV